MSGENIYSAPKSNIEKPLSTLASLIKDFGKLPKTLTVLLQINLYAGIISILFAAVQILEYKNNPDIFYNEGLSFLGGVYALFSLMESVIFIITIVFFSKWIHRANTNAKTFNYPMRMSPGLAVGFFFIPIAMLFMPYKGMKDVWKASDHTREKGHGIVKIWWSIWIITSLIGNVSIRLTIEANTIELLTNCEILYIVEALLNIPLCIIAIKLVKNITQNQYSFIEAANNELES